MILFLGFGLCILAALFAFGTCLVLAIVVCFKQPGLLILAAILAAITALLIAAAVKL